MKRGLKNNQQHQNIVANAQTAPNLGRIAPTKGVHSGTANDLFFDLLKSEVFGLPRGCAKGTQTNHGKIKVTLDGCPIFVMVHAGTFVFDSSKWKSATYFFYCKAFPVSKIYVVSVKDFLEAAHEGIFTFSLSQTTQDKRAGKPFDPETARKMFRYNRRAEDWFEEHDLDFEYTTGVPEYEMTDKAADIIYG